MNSRRVEPDTAILLLEETGSEDGDGGNLEVPCPDAVCDSMDDGLRCYTE